MFLCILYDWFCLVFSYRGHTLYGEAWPFENDSLLDNVFCLLLYIAHNDIPIWCIVNKHHVVLVFQYIH